MNNYGVVRWAAAEIGTLCCGSVEEEVIHVREIRLAIMFFPNWLWWGWHILPIRNWMVTTWFILWVNKSCSETLDLVECYSPVLWNFRRCQEPPAGLGRVSLSPVAHLGYHCRERHQHCSVRANSCCFLTSQVFLSNIRKKSQNWVCKGLCLLLGVEIDSTIDF